MAHLLLGALLFLILSFSGCGQLRSSSPQGDGDTLQSGTIHVGNAPGSVEVADLNHDKLPDLIVTNERDSSVTILLGRGGARFREPSGSPFHAGYNVNDVAVGDFDKDGNLDLAFANHDRQYLTVLLGDGQGGFAAAPGSPFPVAVLPHVHGVATGDFNHDNRPDLVTDSWGNNQVEILFGDSHNLFRTPGTYVSVGKHPYQRLRVADINGDGADDIVTTNLDGDNVTVLLCDGKGAFHEPPGSPFPCGDSPFGVAIGDLNGDRKPDLAIINSPASTADRRGTNGLTVLFGDGTGQFTMMKGSPYEAGAVPNRVGIGDVNGDGINDIVTSDNGGDRVYVFLMQESGGILSSSLYRVGSHPKGVAVADLNGDGKGEIIVCNNADNDISILMSATSR